MDERGHGLAGVMALISITFVHFFVKETGVVNNQKKTIRSNKTEDNK